MAIYTQWGELFDKYRTVRSNNNHTGAKLVEWEHTDEMGALLEEDSACNPEFSVDTIDGDTKDRDHSVDDGTDNTKKRPKRRRNNAVGIIQSIAGDNQRFIKKSLKESKKTRQILEKSTAAFVKFLEGMNNGRRKKIRRIDNDSAVAEDGHSSEDSSEESNEGSSEDSSGDSS